MCLHYDVTSSHSLRALVLRRPGTIVELRHCACACQSHCHAGSSTPRLLKCPHCRVCSMEPQATACHVDRSSAVHSRGRARPQNAPKQQTNTHEGAVRHHAGTAHIPCPPRRFPAINCDALQAPAPLSDDSRPLHCLLLSLLLSFRAHGAVAPPNLKAEQAQDQILSNTARNF